jgi:hypothetical protein
LKGKRAKKFLKKEKGHMALKSVESQNVEFKPARCRQVQLAG